MVTRRLRSAGAMAAAVGPAERVGELRRLVRHHGDHGGAALGIDVSTDEPYRCRCRGRRATWSRSTSGSSGTSSPGWSSAGSTSTWCRRRRPAGRRAGEATRRRVRLQRPRRPGAAAAGGGHGVRAARRGPCVRHLPGPPGARAGARRPHLQAAVRTPWRQPSGAEARRRPGRDHFAEPRVRRRPVEPGRGVATGSGPRDTARCPSSSPTSCRRRSARVRATHQNLNDGTLEGMECLDVPAFSVQYHPEAAPGPTEAISLFDRFAASIGGG